MNSAILRVADMVAAEQALIEGGVSVDELMQRAGRGAAEWIWRACAGHRVTVLCGPGNNGGDGYVIAEAIRSRGGEVVVIAPADPRTPAATAARGAYRGQVCKDHSRHKGGTFVDCLFGSGLTRPLDEAMISLLQGLAASHQLRIAVDVPSGVDCDKGAPLNPGLPPYDLTLALGAWKFAHWLMPSAASMGARRLVPIGVPAQPGAAQLLARPQLAAPPLDAHKYRRGLLAIVAGAMPGAPVLAAKAAMHAGAGYVKLLAHTMPSSSPDELVTDDAPLELSCADPRIAAMLIGPGLGRDDAARGRLRIALARDVPVVLDADALVMLEPEMLKQRKAAIIATPHEGELAQLAQNFGIAPQDKLDLAQALAQQAKMIVVAKGPDTVIATPGGSITLAPSASSWLSTAGSGDVLAGIVASRLATGVSPERAAEQAVWLHGEAARLAGPAFAAGDLAAMVRFAVASAL